MSNKLYLDKHESIRDAVLSVKDKLLKIDEENNNLIQYYSEFNSDMTEKTMEEQNWNDKLFLVYRNDYYDDIYYIFESDYRITEWLKEKWSEWEIWDYGDPNSFLEDSIVIWEFHRDICKVKWQNLYGDSKQFITGWSRKRVFAFLDYEPVFTID